MVGYQPGYGVFADEWPQGTSRQLHPAPDLVMAAVKNDLALVAFAAGPYHAFGPDFGPGLPSGAICSSPRTWASTSTASHWRATRRAERR